MHKSGIVIFIKTMQCVKTYNIISCTYCLSFYSEKKVLIESRYKPDDNNINYQVMFELSKNSAEK